MTAGATNFLVLERDDKLTHHVREEHRIRIAKEQDVVFRNLVQTVEHRCLSRILRSLHQRNSLVSITGDNLGSLIRRTIVTDKHLQLFAGVIQLKDILDLAFDNRLFVVGRNQDRNRRKFNIALFGRLAALKNFAHERECQREQQVAMHQQKEHRPKNNLDTKQELFVHRDIHSFSFSRNWYNIYCNSCGVMESVTVRILIPFGATSTNAGSAFNSHTSK